MSHNFVTLLLFSLILCPLTGTAFADGKLPPEPEGFTLKGDVDNGKLIYKQYCKKCHGKKGDGHGIMAKDLQVKPRNFTDADLMSKQSDWIILQGITEGGAAVGLSDKMTPWKDSLTEDEIMDVATFIRTFAKGDAAK